ncbi:MAG: hypothetical protein M1825_005392 [Sarcosagium campestre]|nr:MAG: hypothetical protein M1825_005392 [Sarcosagium campestre]
MSSSDTGEAKDAPKETITVSEEAPEELTAVVDDLLNSLTTQFSNVSSDIFDKMDDMSRRLDALEDYLEATGTKSPK